MTDDETPSMSGIVLVDRSANALAPPPRAGEQMRDKAIHKSMSANTLRVYGQAWDRFHKWAAGQGVDASVGCDADLVTRWLAVLTEQGKSKSTLDVSLAAVRWKVSRVGLPSLHRDPLVAITMQGLRRIADPSRGGKEPLLLEDLKALSEATRPGTLGTRDRLMLLIGWWAALRRSELVALRWSDMRLDPRGIIVWVRSSKTDQTSLGQGVGIKRPSVPMLDPVLALERWRERCVAQGAPVEGDAPLFRHVREGRIVHDSQMAAQNACRRLRLLLERVGRDAEQFGMHSLRSGFATEAALQGHKLEDISKHLRHERLEMTLRYVRKARLLEDSPTAGLDGGLA